MLSVINKKEGQEMKRMENDRNGLPSLQYQAWESLTVAAERGLKNIPQHWEPNGHVSARCHCHPLSTSVGWPQTPSCWKQLDTAPHTRPTVCRMPRSRYAWTTLRVRHWSSTISLAKSDWTPLSRPDCIFHNQPAICHKQLWSCNPIGKETAPEFGTALFLRQSGFWHN